MIKGVYRLYRLVDEADETIGYRRTIVPDDGRRKKIVGYSHQPDGGFTSASMVYYDAYLVRKDRGQAYRDQGENTNA